ASGLPHCSPTDFPSPRWLGAWASHTRRSAPPWGRLQSPAQPPLDGSPHEMVVENVLVPVRTREEVRRLLSLGCSRADVARRLGIAKSTVTYHARRVGLEIDARAARRYDWPAIQRYYDAGHTM